jgi:hypothetical protein
MLFRHGVRQGRGNRGKANESKSMPSKEIQFQLDAAAQEWLRMRFTTVRGDVTAFTIQYETTIGEDRVPVVRYDSAHGCAHRDLLDRRGRVIH